MSRVSTAAVRLRFAPARSKRQPQAPPPLQPQAQKKSLDDAATGAAGSAEDVRVTLKFVEPALATALAPEIAHALRLLQACGLLEGLASGLASIRNLTFPE